MDSSGRRFSFMRMINNAVPNFSNDSKDDVDLAPVQADALVRYQLSLPYPPYLSCLSFKMAGLTPSDSISKKMHAALLKHGIIAAAPASAPPSAPESRKGSIISLGRRSSVPAVNVDADSDYRRTEANFSQGDEGRTVFTERIGRDFVNQLAVISVHAQRKLVGALFFWEDECKRWALLGQEEEEILKTMELEQEGGLPDYDGVGREEVGEAGSSAGRGNVKHQLDVALEAVKMKRGLVPSARGEATANVTKGVGKEDLPSYT